MIVVTGAAGFIGSCLAAELDRKGTHKVLIVDDFSNQSKYKNLDAIAHLDKIERDDFIDWLEVAENVDAVIHIGARTDTTEFDNSILEELNLEYTKSVWSACVEKEIPMIYASSAATYGNGEFGYDDNSEIIEKLVPLNPYGVSKNEFDKWAFKQEEQPPNWYGLKFFNVYGPNEYHKGRMASVIMHAYYQIESKGSMKLFRSHNPDYADGGQLRDFVYVKDLISVIQFLMESKPESGLYNLGTGTARAFLDLAKSTFSALAKKEEIEFIDTPTDIRDKYQYFTEANMRKLRNAGYSKQFYTLETGIEDYVNNYLSQNKYY
ncbi:MAG: ADP-glyceromanno-heptose 6-epimerase [Salibacteraceae bacterium]|nr:ADP-glyceromanno-heptose 6-epimerase [Salibacteraceae bacterium]